MTLEQPSDDPLDEQESVELDTRLAAARRQAVAMMIGSVVLVLGGIWLGQWSLPLLALFLGVRGVRHFKQPHLVPITAQDVAQRIIASKDARPLLSGDAGTIAERVASLEDDLEKVERDTMAMMFFRQGLTRVGMPFTLAGAIFLGIVALGQGNISGILFATMLAVVAVFLLVKGEQTTAQRKEAAEILRSQIRELRSLPVGRITDDGRDGAKRG